MARKWTAASAAIVSMWIAVLFISIFAPELESHDVSGGTTTLPVAGIVAAGVAFIATVVVATVGFSGRGSDDFPERERLERRIAELEARSNGTKVDAPGAGALLGSE